MKKKHIKNDTNWDLIEDDGVKELYKKAIRQPVKKNKSNDEK